jgi:hypothetical protein
MSNTDFLLARPSMLEGFARVLDMGSTINIYNESLSPNEADSIAISNDFQMVGQDILIAMAHQDKVQSGK